MFFFKSKKNSDDVSQETPVVSKKTAAKEGFDWEEKRMPVFLDGLINYKEAAKAIMIDVTAFKNPKSIAMLSTVINDILRDFAVNTGSRIFELVNKSALLVVHPSHEEQFQALMVRLGFAFQSELAQTAAENIEEAPFIKIYDNTEQFEQLKAVISEMVPYTPQIKEESSKVNLSYKLVSVLGGKKKLKELSPDILDKMQKSLQQVDFSSLIRRQSVCAIIGKSAPQRIFEEVYVSIPDLRDILMPDVNLTSNPWLFMDLTETLDKRVLAHVSRHDDGSLVSNFSLNLNVATILSDDFFAFDESIPAPLRSSIILELQLVDIFNDVKAFLLAKAFAQYRGYKICIDGITVDKLQYINRANLNSDLIKIIWHPAFLDIINEDKHFRDYVNKAERAKMILCRVDDAKAIEIGNSLGINLYQGRYVQAELNKHRK